MALRYLKLNQGITGLNHLNDFCTFLNNFTYADLEKLRWASIFIS